MSQIENRLTIIDNLYNLQHRSQWMNRFHPLTKLLLTVFYIAIAVSVDKYQLTRIILMALYIVVSYNLADLSFRNTIWRVRMILPLVMAVGIFNPIFDRAPGMTVGSLVISSGWISMFSLMLKGVYSVLAAYLLIATTSIEEICYALRLLHVPKIMVTVILLTYRYLLILGNEADRIMTAYILRAPSQKGINYKAWGPLIGQWLLRSFDRAERVYDAMLLRGFNGEFPPMKSYGGTKSGNIYAAVCVAALLAVKFLPMLG